MERGLWRFAIARSIRIKLLRCMIFSFGGLWVGPALRPCRLLWVTLDPTLRLWRGPDPSTYKGFGVKSGCNTQRVPKKTDTVIGYESSILRESGCSISFERATTPTIRSPRSGVPLRERGLVKFSRVPEIRKRVRGHEANPGGR